MSENEPNAGAEQWPAPMPDERDDPGAAPDIAGVPETADDETPGSGEVPEPQREPMPGDRSVASDDFGTTAAETRHGEPLAGKLAREEADPAQAPEGDRVRPPIHEERDTARPEPDTVGDVGAPVARSDARPTEPTQDPDPVGAPNAAELTDADLTVPPDASEPAETRPEHRARTGAEQPWEPEDLAEAEGHDPTPGAVERARRRLDEEGPSAIEKEVP